VGVKMSEDTTTSVKSLSFNGRMDELNREGPRNSECIPNPGNFS
jgi:hypothetical protein